MKFFYLEAIIHQNLHFALKLWHWKLKTDSNQVKRNEKFKHWIPKMEEFHVWYWKCFRKMYSSLISIKLKDFICTKWKILRITAFNCPKKCKRNRFVGQLFSMFSNEARARLIWCNFRPDKLTKIEENLENCIMSVKMKLMTSENNIDTLKIAIAANEADVSFEILTRVVFTKENFFWNFYSLHYENHSDSDNPVD